MDFDSFNADALAEVTEILGSAFTYRGTCYKGIINELEATSILQDGGLLEGLATVIVVSKAVLPSKPAIGETVLSGLKTLRIESVKEDETAFELRCKTAST